jgi:mannose-6-phosphate isomerase-like protein (cupin superfamily)
VLPQIPAGLAAWKRNPKSRRFTAMAYVVDESEARTRDLRGGRGVSLQLIDESMGSKFIDVHVNVLRPGSGPGPYHYHSNAENIYYVLQGTAQVIIDGRKILAGPGVAIWIQPNERHGVENVGEDELRLVEIKAPASSDFILVPEEELPSD